MDLAFFDAKNVDTDVFESTTCVDSKEVAHRLLDVLGEHLLSTNEENNMLAQVFVNEKGTLESFDAKLEMLLKPFAEQSPKLKTEINLFKTKVSNAVRNMNAKAKSNWNGIKEILPTLQIFCKQLIDRVSNF